MLVVLQVVTVVMLRATVTIVSTPWTDSDWHLFLFLLSLCGSFITQMLSDEQVVIFLET